MNVFTEIKITSFLITTNSYANEALLRVEHVHKFFIHLIEYYLLIIFNENDFTGANAYGSFK